MSSFADALLAEVARLDPDKAAHLRWVRPQLGDEAVALAARSFLDAHPRGASAGGAGVTLIEEDFGFDPDETTAVFETFDGPAAEGALAEDGLE